MYFLLTSRCIYFFVNKICKTFNTCSFIKQIDIYCLSLKIDHHTCNIHPSEVKKTKVKKRTKEGKKNLIIMLFFVNQHTALKL